MAGTHTTNITFEKKGSKGAISAATKHNERLGDPSKYPDHIDARRTHLNQTVLGEEHMDIYNEITKRVTGKKEMAKSVSDHIKKSDLHYQDGKKVYDNAVLAFETVMQYPGDLVWSKLNKLGEPCPVQGLDAITDIKVNDERAAEHTAEGYFLWPKNMKEYNEWVQASLDYLKEKVGEDNILQAVTHMDESVPHLHVIGVPFYETDRGIEKLSYDRLKIDGRKNLSQVQTEYAKALEHLGYVRGEEFSVRVDYSTHYKFREREAVALSAELPKGTTIKEANELYKDAVVQIEAANMEVDRMHASGKQISKLRAREQELKNEIKEKDKELESLRSENSRLKQIVRTKECEMRGISLHPDQDMIDNAYLPLQQQLIDLGIRYYKSMDLDMNLPERENEIPETEVSDN